MLPSLQFTAYTMTSAIGAGLAATLSALRTKRSGLHRTPWETVTDLDTWIGEVDGLDGHPLRGDLAAFECRNNRLAQLALRQDGFEDAVVAAIKRHGPQRVGVLLGTSSSGVLSSEIAYRDLDLATGALPASLDYRHTHNAYSVGDFVRSYFGIEGPAFVVSTACSSASKVFASAQRFIAAGLIDAAVVGGVDSLCLTTLYGFESLQLISREPCKPFDVARDGISIGEAAAYVLLEKTRDDARIRLSGVGESSDAHHMSAPHPEGLGARNAMQQALDNAGLSPRDIGYVALHGTATPSNDSTEDHALNTLFGGDTPCSSLKGHTGHTLGAAGAVNVVIGALALQHGFAPAGVGTTQVQSDLKSRYLLENLPRAQMRHVLCNAFGFGGSNCSVIISKGPAA